MQRESIKVDELNINPYRLWNRTWFLLTSGNFNVRDFNTMTVSWGSFGSMWGKPFAQVVVRPARHTYNFIEKYDSFTLCAFGEPYRQALEFLGTHSGRDSDKIMQVGLTPIASSQVAAPGFAEAELIIECLKIYWDDFKPANFLDSEIGEHYPASDYHRVYYGEIVAVSGIGNFRRI